MLKTRKSVLITGAVLCVASLIFCKIWFAPIKYSFLFILLFVLLYLDFFLVYQGLSFCIRYDAQAVQ